MTPGRPSALQCIRYILVGLLLAAGVGPALADCPPLEATVRTLSRAIPADQAYRKVLSMLNAGRCFGDPIHDPSALVKSFNEATPDASDDLGRRLAATLAALSLLRDYAQTEAGRTREPEWSAFHVELQGMSDRLQSLIREGQDTPRSEQLSPVIPDHPWGQGAITQGGETFKLPQGTFNLLDVSTCRQLGCTLAVDRSNQLRLVELVRRLKGYLDKAAEMKLSPHLEMLSRQWTAYSDKARHQYFWETWANGWAIRTQGCNKQGLDDGGNVLGFCDVPSWQWIVLHPEPALSFNPRAGSAKDLQANLLIEVIGYHRWKWVGRSMDELGQQRGISLVAAELNHDGRNQWGWGLRGDIGNGYNLALLRTPGNRWSVMVSFSLGEKLLGRNQKLKPYLRSLQQSTLADIF